MGSKSRNYRAKCTIRDRTETFIAAPYLCLLILYKLSHKKTHLTSKKLPTVATKNSSFKETRVWKNSSFRPTTGWKLGFYRNSVHKNSVSRIDEPYLLRFRDGYGGRLFRFVSRISRLKFHNQNPPPFTRPTNQPTIICKQGKDVANIHCTKDVSYKRH
jgi:hypothetical protein